MSSRLIDAHLHLWDLTGRASGDASDGAGPGPYSWLGPELGVLNRTHDASEAWQVLGGAGVEGAVLVQADDTAADTAAMLQAAHANPWVLGVVGWIPLDDPAGARSALEELTADPKFKGIRHLVHDDPRRDFLELATVRESLEAVAAAGLVFDVPDAFPGHLGQTVQLARDVDSLTVVLDHLGKPPVMDQVAMEDWRVGFRALAELPQTVAKVSGLFTPGAPYTAAALRPVWEEALEAFGPKRLMFGGDWPISRLGGSYADITGVLFELVSELSVTEQQAVLGGTATRVYGLETATS